MQESPAVAHPDLPDTWSSLPTWIYLPPVSPPVQTNSQILPISELHWEDFERLCLRLLLQDSEIFHGVATGPVEGLAEPVARLYGQRGQAQFGIDVYARDLPALGEAPTHRKYICLQSRRVQEVGASILKSTVEKFLNGHWADVTKKFIYATSASLISTQLSDEIESLADLLTTQSIEFSIWDQEALSLRLKHNPELVDDFFGRHWVNRFCGPETAAKLGTRLDASQVKDLRTKLHQVYAATFGMADSGHIVFRSIDTNPIELADRFVTPDLVSATSRTASTSQPVTTSNEPQRGYPSQQLVMEEAAAWNAIAPDETVWFPRHPIWHQRTQEESTQVLERRSAEQWIGTEPMQVIVGEPGAGKSTLLRYLVLDLLNPNPNWKTTARRWGQCLPVWLPFHFFTQRVVNQTGKAASVDDAVQAWLEQHGAGQVWPLVEHALQDKRLLLVVDGLDEWISEDAGRIAVSALQAFANFQSVQLIVSTRPNGLGRLSLSAGWDYKRIASLTPEQQKELSLSYFAARETNDHPPLSSDVIERQVDDFLSEIHSSSDLRTISGTPLFLVLLVWLRLSKFATLPSRRFEVYEEAVSLLVSHHPASRRTAAAVTASRRTMPVYWLRAVLSKVAFMNQERGNVSTVHENALRKDFINALKDPNLLAKTDSDALETAEQLLEISESELGLLVRMGPSELAFLHRMLQDQLAAEYICDQLDPSQQKSLFEKHVGDPNWREILLIIMNRLTRSSELRELIEVIRQRINETPTGLLAREILAEVAFGSNRIPARENWQSALEIVRVVETHPYGPHRARLLESVLSGLESEVTKDLVCECLERWTMLVREPTFQLVQEVGRFSHVASLSSIVQCTLIHALRYPDKRIAYEGAKVIAIRYARDASRTSEERDDMYDELLGILADPPSGLAQAAALSALALAWRDDQNVNDMLIQARSHAQICVRIIALGDAFGVLVPSLLGGPATVHSDVPGPSEDEIISLTGFLKSFDSVDTHFGLLVSIITNIVLDRPSILVEELAYSGEEVHYFDSKELLWTVALTACPNDEAVVNFVCQELKSTALRGPMLFFEVGKLLASAYPSESRYRQRIASAIEETLEKLDTPLMEWELSWLAAVDNGPVMKKLLLSSLEDPGAPHWAAEALVENFGSDPEVLQTLHTRLMGEASSASLIANVITRVLPEKDVIPRLRTIVKELLSSSVSGVKRYDIVVLALSRACREQGIASGPEFENNAELALSVLPYLADTYHESSSHRIAASFYPSGASKAAFMTLSEVVSRPLEPYLSALCDYPDDAHPFVIEAFNTLRSLPSYLRNQICQYLAERNVAPDDLVLQLTNNWSDEVSPLNKSVGSLAYHKALVRARARGRIDDCRWHSALVRIREHASCYGPDYGARRRGAWIGMFVFRDWSPVLGVKETNETESPLHVPLLDWLHGPDMTMLQQVGSHWSRLREKFGEDLLLHFKASRGDRSTDQVWDSLALVAAQNPALQRELFHAVIEHGELLKMSGVLIWFITLGSSSSEAIADAIVDYLEASEEYDYWLVSFLVASAARFNLDSEKLRLPLEAAHGTTSGFQNFRVLETLAVLFPDHPLVIDSWGKVKSEVDNHRGEGTDVTFSTYFALAFAATRSTEFLDLMENQHDNLARIGNRFLDKLFVQHVSLRLQRDVDAVEAIHGEVLKRETSDQRTALYASILAESVGLDHRLRIEIERRIETLGEKTLAPTVYDHSVSSFVSVRIALTRAADWTWHDVSKQL